MKNLPALLKDADPLGDERPRADHERRALRKAILDAPPSRRDAPPRQSVVMTAAVLVLVAIAGGFAMWSRGSVDVVAAVRFEVRLAEDHPADGLTEAAVTGSDRQVYLHVGTVISNSDIAQANVLGSDAAPPVSISLRFTPEGAAKMSRATQAHIGRPLAILIDGEVVMAPVIRDPITADAMITGDYTRAQADRIASGVLGR
jgi:hypothetical protein